MWVFLRKLALVSALLLSAACANLSAEGVAATPLRRDTLDTFVLEGRFSLRQQDNSFSGRLSWRHAAGGDEILLATPFGQGVAEITRDSAGARLMAGEGKTYVAENVAKLTAQVLGYPLPLDDMADWLRGRRHGTSSLVIDIYGRPTRLEEAGWRIEYEYDAENHDAQALPVSLSIERDGEQTLEPFTLRLRIDEWTELFPINQERQ